MKEDLTGIILAGGKASRLGTDKGKLQFKGHSLIERAVSVLTPFCGRLLLSSGQSDYNYPGLDEIPDIRPGMGPMMGILSCLHASETRYNLVLAVDNAFVGPEFFTYLLEKLQDEPAAVPYLQDRYFEPLAGCYSRDLIPLMETMLSEGNARIPDLFDKSGVLKLLVEKEFREWHKEYFRSINSPSDLDFLQASSLSG